MIINQGLDTCTIMGENYISARDCLQYLLFHLTKCQLTGVKYFDMHEIHNHESRLQGFGKISHLQDSRSKLKQVGVVHNCYVPTVHFLFGIFKHSRI